MDGLSARRNLLQSDLSRIESLGDNCELGFVLSRLGHQDGSLFRWSSIHADSLLATLKGDFDGFYEFDELEPMTSEMVRDRRYGTAWHSQMVCIKQGNGWAFKESVEARRGIHAEEAAKRLYLLRKFRQKLDRADPVFVVKSNAGIADETLEALHYQLFRRIGSLGFKLLEVRETPAKAGRVETIDRNLLRGYVSRFAPYTNARDGDDLSWHSVLAAALAPGANIPDDTSRKLASKAEPIALRFPTTASPDFSRRLHADIRAGVSDIHHGNEWCRLIDDDVYRLHGREIGQDATQLCWAGVCSPAGWFLRLNAAWTVPGTLPLAITLVVSDGRQSFVTREECGPSNSRCKLAVEIPAGFRSSLTILLRAEPLQPLARGERAVADLDPIIIGPMSAEERERFRASNGQLRVVIETPPQLERSMPRVVRHWARTDETVDDMGQAATNETVGHLATVA